MEIKSWMHPESTDYLDRIVFRVDGYQDLTVTNPALNLEPGGVTDLKLVPESGRPVGSLRLVYGSGDAVADLVRIQDLKTGEQIYEGELDAPQDGWIRAIPVPEGKYRIDLQWAGESIEVGSADFLETDGNYQATVVAKAAFCSLQIAGVPQLPPRIGALSQGFNRFAFVSDGQDSTLLGVSVPPGNYLVGPRDWSWLQLNAAGEPGLGVLVEARAGQQIQLQWRGEWMGVDALRGRVWSEGVDRNDYWIEPVYRDPASFTVLFGDAEQRIGLSKDGVYSLPAGMPAPVALLVMTRHVNRWESEGHVVDLFAPGTDCSPPQGVLEVHVGPSSSVPENGRWELQYSIDPSAFSLPWKGRPPIAKITSVGRRDFRLDRVPLALKTVSVIVGGTRKSYPVRTDQAGRLHVLID
ncbi:MAG: hypothetical protein R3F17_09255 [Planctomycetota bacterium]